MFGIQKKETLSFLPAGIQNKAKKGVYYQSLTAVEAFEIELLPVLPRKHLLYKYKTRVNPLVSSREILTLCTLARV